MFIGGIGGITDPTLNVNLVVRRFSIHANQFVYMNMNTTWEDARIQIALIAFYVQSISKKTPSTNQPLLNSNSFLL